MKKRMEIRLPAREESDHKTAERLGGQEPRKKGMESRDTPGLPDSAMYPPRDRQRER